MINSIVEKAYCISLERRPDRWVAAEEQFKNNGMVVEKFLATDGALLEPNPALHSGEAGCLDSHRRVLKDAIDNDLECIAVFEDDVYFVENFASRFDEYFREVPSDWQFLYLSFNRHSGQTMRVTDRVVRISNAYSAHALFLKRDAINYSYNLMLNDSLPSDVYFGMAQYAYPAYGPSRMLAGQRTGFSDIVQQDVNYDWIYGL
jgi:hypothetical protein